MPKTTAPFGSWESPISAELVAQSGTGSSALPREIQVDGDHVYWIEQRPEEGGRYVIARTQTGGGKQVITPSEFNVRSRVHEYGGGAYRCREDTIVFVNDDDQRLYRQDPAKIPYPITPAPAHERSQRYADGVFSPDGRWMLWVRERHDERLNTQNEIVLLPSDGSSPPRLLLSGHDFFSNPRFNNDGNEISWLCWDHPSMPWDSTELWTASIDIQKGKIGASERIAGGEGISIFQPEWGPDNLLYFISDRSGWWNIYRQNPDGSKDNISPLKAEFGYPQWLFGFTKYTFLSDNQILASYKVRGQAKLGLVDTVGKSVTPIAAPYTSFENPSMRSNGEGTAWFFAGSSDAAPTLCSFDLATGSTAKVLELRPLEINNGYVAEPEQIEFRNRRGSDSYAFFYSPTNPMYSPPKGEMPPLIVMSHGGPTSSARPHLDLETQFWTSRGYAVVDVDYSGSVGYGRAYRERLNGQMGIVDVDDCVDAALSLTEAGKVDPKRLIIRGGSAGGYVTLSALTLHDVFSIGCSYYGIADLESLAVHTHKFEAHYLDTLIGPYPEEKEKFEQRSPINHIDHLKCPMILFQGLEDQVVPPEQSELMKEALDAKGLAYAYVTFQHEGHGFNDAESILQALKAEQYFYTRILDIPWTTGVVPLQIQNLDPP